MGGCNSWQKNYVRLIRTTQLNLNLPTKIKQMKLFASLMLLLTCHFTYAQDDLLTTPPEVEKLYNQVMPAINKKYSSVVQQVAASVKGGDISADSISRSLKRAPVMNKLGEKDIDALIVCVVYLVSKDQKEELKGLMIEQKRQNVAKKAVRESPVTVKKKTIADTNTKNKQILSLENQSDLSEQTQKKIEAVSDRRKKANEVASTIIKKHNETLAAVVNNMR